MNFFNNFTDKFKRDNEIVREISISLTKPENQDNKEFLLRQKNRLDIIINNANKISQEELYVGDKERKIDFIMKSALNAREEIDKLLSVKKENETNNNEALPSVTTVTANDNVISGGRRRRPRKTRQRKSRSRKAKKSRRRR